MNCDASPAQPMKTKLALKARTSCAVSSLHAQSVVRSPVGAPLGSFQFRCARQCRSVRTFPLRCCRTTSNAAPAGGEVPLLETLNYNLLTVPVGEEARERGHRQREHGHRHEQRARRLDRRQLCQK